MLTWLIIKKSLKKTWTWLGHNWIAPFIVLYTLVLWFLFRKPDKAYEILEIRAESYKTQIDAINKAHEEEIKRRDAIFNKYTETLVEINKKHMETTIALMQWFSLKWEP